MLRRTASAFLLVFLFLTGPSLRAQLVGCEKSAAAPVAIDDLLQWPGGAIVVDVLGNDYDPDGDIISITGFGSAAHGTVAYTEDGEALLYTPSDASATADDFTYTITDGQFTATASVHLSVQPQSPPPPPPVQARVWFDSNCDHTTCFFTARWDNINDTPRFTSWAWGDGKVTNDWTSLTALHDYTPGTWNAVLTITFVSGKKISSAASPVVVAMPVVECAFLLPAIPAGGINPASSLSFNTRLTYLSTFQQNDFTNYDYFWDFADGRGLIQVDPLSVFALQGVVYPTPATRMVNFIIKPKGDPRIAGQCPRNIEFVNQPPIIDFTWSPGDGVTEVSRYVHFDLTSMDELGAVDWEANYGDGTFGGGAPRHLYARPGNYVVVFKATDKLGASSTVQKSISVPADPPVADYLFNCTGRTCRLNAGRTYDDSGEATYAWNFRDGSTIVSSKDRIVDHTFAGDGPYDVTLTVDNGVRQSYKTKRISPRVPLAPPLLFYTVPPCRVSDTQREGTRLQGAVNVAIAGRCGVPADAKAVTLNATIVEPSAGGSLFLHAAGSGAPLGSAIDFTPQLAPRTNSFIAPLGAGGALTATPSAGVQLDLELDVTGYLSDRISGVAPAKGPYRAAFIYPLPPGFNSASQPPGLAAGTNRLVRIRDANTFLPVDAEAAWLQLNATNPTASGRISVTASDLPPASDTSTLSVQSGVPQSNASFVALGRRTADDVNVLYTAAAGAASDFRLTGNTWFAPSGAARYYAITPCRALDTRDPVFGTPRLAKDAYRTYTVQGNCGVPYGVKAIAIVVHIVNADTPGTASLDDFWYFDEPLHVNFLAGDTIAVTQIVRTSKAYSAEYCCDQDASIRLHGGGADVVVDVIGYLVNEDNAPPTASPDVANAVVNVPVTIDVVSNDADANGEPVKLSARAVFNPPTLGTASRASDSAITYTATSAGIDALDYEITDSHGSVAHGTLTINVRATNDAPLAVNDAITVAPGSSTPVNVLANDSDPTASPIRLTDAGIVVPPTLGTATRQSNTAILYSAPASAGGTDSLTYEITNAAGVTARARVVITINRPPAAVNDTAYVQSGTAAVIDVLSNDTDPDGNVPRLDAPAIVSPPSAGTATVHSDGRRIVYTPSGAAGDQFSYAVIDGAGGRSVGVVKTIVNLPPLAVNDSFGIVTGTAQADYNVIANDSDPNAGDTVRLTASPFKTLPGKGSVSRKSDTTITYVPAAGAAGTDSFTIEVTDPHGSKATSSVAVTFCAAAAAISPGGQPANTSIYRGSQAVLSVTATGGGLMYQWYEGVSPSITTPVGGNSATLQVSPASTKSYWVRVSNACGAVNSSGATVTVLNNPPLARITFTCAGTQCSLSGATSTDDLGISSYTWSLSDTATTYPGATLAQTFPYGCHTVTLQTTDTENASTTTKQTVAAGDYTPQLPWKLIGVSSDTHAMSYRPAGQSIDFTTTGNLNGILDIGEKVVIEPTWKVTSTSTFAATATAISSSSPSVTGTLLVPAASYTAPAGFSNCWATGKCYVVQAQSNGARATPHVDLYLTENTAMPGVTGPAVIHVGNSFIDVPPSVWYYGIVESATHAGLTTGCGDGNFCPASPLTRGAVPVWLLKAKYGPAYNPPACTSPGPFLDVPCTYYSAPWIQQLKAEGITSGTGGGNYSPDNTLTRAEMAPFILRTLYGATYQPPTCTTNPYTDVPCTHWAGPWIADLKNRGFATDCALNSYCPETAVNRVDAAFLLYRSFGLAIDRRICNTAVYTSAPLNTEADR